MTADTHAGVTDRDIREQRALVAHYRNLAELAERELARMLAAAGRRPGDGSDQPAMFEVEGPGEAVLPPRGVTPMPTLHRSWWHTTNDVTAGSTYWSDCGHRRRPAAALSASCMAMHGRGRPTRPRPRGTTRSAPTGPAGGRPRTTPKESEHATRLHPAPRPGMFRSDPYPEETTMTAPTDLPATIEELIPALSADRDARVTRCHGTLACIEMDDAGGGPFERVCTDPVASELVRRGLVRDAR
jgi:hypothetical protein